MRNRKQNPEVSRLQLRIIELETEKLRKAVGSAWNEPVTPKIQASSTYGIVSKPSWTTVNHTDSVNHPSHYTTHPSGVECIDIVEHMSFNLGNAIKYVWRAGLKHPNRLEDLKKARWYLDREIVKLEKEK